MFMILILRKDVENLGRYGDQVKVAMGYARNYLIPNALAVEATPSNIKQLEAEKEAFLKKAAVRRERAEKLRSELEAVNLVFSRKSADDEKLFGSVTSHDVEAALKEKGFVLDKKTISLSDPIKTLGQFTASVKLHPDVVAVVKVAVNKAE